MKKINQSLNMISDFKLMKTIGEGTFGKVKSAYQISTGQIVSIKILNKNRIKGKENIERIIKEIKILKSLNHPNLIKLYQIIEDNQHYYLVTEYANGGELFDLIVNKKRLSEKEASIFFAQLILAIEYLQKNKISHRDIKPENLLIKNNKELILIDFGLSSKMKNGKLLSTPCGSSCYAAPEILLPFPYDGFASDIWSCGVVLFTMVCGYLPYEEENSEKLYKKIFSTRLEIPYRISDICRDLINKILVVNPKKRITLEEIKTHPFLNYGLMWYKKNFMKNIIKYDLKLENINMDILENMKRYGVEEPKEKIISEILKNKKNRTTTIYYLLIEKYGLDWKYIDENKGKLKVKPKNFEQIKRKTLSEDEESSCKLNESINNENGNIKNDDLKKNKQKLIKKLNIKKLDFSKLKTQSPVQSERIINKKILIRGENCKLMNKDNATPRTNRAYSNRKNSINISSTSFYSPKRKKNVMSNFKLTKDTNSLKNKYELINENSISIEIPVSLTQIVCKYKNHNFNKKLFINNFKNIVNNHNQKKYIYISSEDITLGKNKKVKINLQKYATHSSITNNFDSKKRINKPQKKNKQYNTAVLYKKIAQIDKSPFINNTQKNVKINKMSNIANSVKSINIHMEKKSQRLYKINNSTIKKNTEDKSLVLSKRNYQKYSTIEQLIKSVELRESFKKTSTVLNKMNV